MALQARGSRAACRASAAGGRRGALLTGVAGLAAVAAPKAARAYGGVIRDGGWTPDPAFPCSPRRGRRPAPLPPGD